MQKLLLLAAAGVGYVLGARAGRTRYEQLKTAYDRVKNDPRVQQRAAHVAEVAKEQAPVVKDKIASVAETAKEKVAERTSGSSSAAGAAGASGSASSTDTDELLEELHPDSTARQEDPYPKGDLP